MSRHGAVAAKDVDSVHLLRAIAWMYVKHDRWVITFDLEPLFDAPWKVVNAKLRRLIHQGLVDGCTCGCSGNFELTVSGWESIRR